MIVCDLVQTYPADRGGIRTYIEAKRNHIRGQTADEHVLIMAGSEDTIVQEGRLRTYTVKGSHLPGGHPGRFIFRLDKVLEILNNERPHLVELGTPYWLPWAAFRYRQKHQGAITGYFHGDFTDSPIEPEIRKWLGRPVAGRVGQGARHHARSVYSKCDATVVATRMYEKKLNHLGLTNTRFIPLGVDGQVFHPLRRDTSLWKKHGLVPGTKVMIYCGRLDQEKSVLDLVEAHRMIHAENKPNLVLMGDGPLSAHLQSVADIDPTLHVLPCPQNPVQLARYLASADIYATAASHQTFGLSVLEAQACGLPVVGVAAGAMTERVAPGIGFLAHPGSVGELAIAMVRCLSLDSRAMGQTARQVATNLYSWPQTMMETMDLYRSLVGVQQPQTMGGCASSLAVGMS